MERRVCQITPIVSTSTPPPPPTIPAFRQLSRVRAVMIRMNPGWLDPVIYAAGHTQRAFRTRPSSAGGPDRPAIQHLGPGPRPRSPAAALPGGVCAHQPSDSPLTDIEVGRDRPARHRRGVLDRRPVRRVDKRRRRRGGRLDSQAGSRTARSPAGQPGKRTGRRSGYRVPQASPVRRRGDRLRAGRLPASSPGRRSCKKVPSHRVAGQPAWLPPGVCVAARGGS